MSFKTSVIEALRTIQSGSFNTSGEGSTSNGVHEDDVSKYFIDKGFPKIEAVIWYTKTNKKGVETKAHTFIMNKDTHTPTLSTLDALGAVSLILDYENGFYQITQPYSVGRGSFNPSPDMYLLNIQEKRIVEWLGIECKSSKSMTPMWNDNLPRHFNNGNIIYLFTGKPSAISDKHTGIFTHDIFFNGEESTQIRQLYAEISELLISKWTEKGFNNKFPMLRPTIRQKCEQNRAFTIEQMNAYTARTIDFLDSLDSFSRSFDKLNEMPTDTSSLDDIIGSLEKVSI